MDVAGFKATLGNEAPPASFSADLVALWWEARGDWGRAHETVAADEAGRDSAWVHAYLHRREGDLGNARYWYERAGRPVARGALEGERDAIVAALPLVADRSA